MKKNEWLVGAIGLTSLVTIIVVFILFMITALSGCEPSSKQITTTADPMTLLPKPDPNWIAKYGDSKESRLVYSMAFERYERKQYDLAIIRKIVDPNDPNSVESRLKKLELAKSDYAAVEIDSNDPNKGK
jgi:hypothetical protein